MAVAKKKKSKFIVRKSKKTGKQIKLYGGPMLKVLAAEKARKKKRNSKSVQTSAGKTRNSAAKVKNARKSKIERLVRVAGGDRLDDAYQILANPKKKKRNISEGFVDGSGVFHPIRSARDYSEKKAGESVDRRTRTGKQGARVRGRHSALRSSKIGVERVRRNSALVIVNPKRKRNGLYETFHGEEVREITTDLAPDGTPNNVDILGKIDRIYFQKNDEHISENGKTKSWLEFGCNKEERPKLASNQAGNCFYIVGNLTPFTPNGTFGEVTRIEYSARKPHIEGHDKEVGYWHKLGEESGIRPVLETDHEGFLILVGGDYRTTADGIIN